MRFPWPANRVVLALAMVTGGLGCLGADAPQWNPGLKVGEKAPSFELKDAEGVVRQAAELRGDDRQYLALVFYRSADW